MRTLTTLTVVVLALSACKGDPTPNPAPAPTSAAPRSASAPGEASPAPAPSPTADPAPAPAPDPAPAPAGATPYKKDGIAMQVPAGWSVSLDEVDTEIAWTRTLHIENQDSGLVILTCFKELDLSAEAYLSSTIDAMKDAVAPARIERTGEMTTSKATIAGAERDGHTARYKIIIGEVDVPHTASVYRADLAPNQCIVLMQASDDEIVGYREPFATILTSLAAAD